MAAELGWDAVEVSRQRKVYEEQRELAYV